MGSAWSCCIIKAERPHLVQPPETHPSYLSSLEEPVRVVRRRVRGKTKDPEAPAWRRVCFDDVAGFGTSCTMARSV